MAQLKQKKGKIDVVVGLQYGREGKNRVVSYMAGKYDVVCPANCLPVRPHKSDADTLRCLPLCSLTFSGSILLGDGAIISPVSLKDDWERISSVNPNVSLVISSKATLCMPGHEIFDEASAMYKTEHGFPCGETKGACAAASDCAVGMQLRVGDIYSPDFPSRYNAVLNHHLGMCKVFAENFSAEERMDEINSKTADYIEAVEWMKEQQIGNIEYLINDVVERGGKILAVCPDGTMNDSLLGLAAGACPVATTATGALDNLGVKPAYLKNVVGVAKAYTTVYSNGVMPGETSGKDLRTLQCMGNEYVSENGDRCGWIDLVQLKYSCMVNGVTELALTKIDVLCSLNGVKAVSGYKLPDGTVDRKMPYDLDGTYEPYYVEFDWKRSIIDDAAKYNDLPECVKSYISFIETFVGVPVKTVSYGPGDRQLLTKTK